MNFVTNTSNEPTDDYTTTILNLSDLDWDSEGAVRGTLMLYETYIRVGVR